MVQTLEAKQVPTNNEDLLGLIRALDEELAQTYGSAMKNYSPHNTLSTVRLALVLYANDRPVACGCYRIIDEGSVEIKRMFVEPDHRGKGYSKLILSALEDYARQAGFSKAILEAGNLQTTAMKLYGSMGYKIIPNYGPYVNLENSVCYEKHL